MGFCYVRFGKNYLFKSESIFLNSSRSSLADFVGRQFAAIANGEGGTFDQEVLKMAFGTLRGANHFGHLESK